MEGDMMKKVYKSRKRHCKQIICSLSGMGFWDTWMTFRVPAWLVLLILAVLISPEMAIKVVIILAQFIQLVSQFAK